MTLRTPFPNAIIKAEQDHSQLPTHSARTNRSTGISCNCKSFKHSPHAFFRFLPLLKPTSSLNLPGEICDRLPKRNTLSAGAYGVACVLYIGATDVLPIGGQDRGPNSEATIGTVGGGLGGRGEIVKGIELRGGEGVRGRDGGDVVTGIYGGGEGRHGAVDVCGDVPVQGKSMSAGMFRCHDRSNRWARLVAQQAKLALIANLQLSIDML